MVPGLGEHTGRYVHVGDFFQNAGFNVIGIDVRGQGRSGGPQAMWSVMINFWKM